MKKTCLIAAFSVLSLLAYSQTTNEKIPQLVAAEKNDSVLTVQSNSVAVPASSGSSTENGQQAPKNGSNTGAAPQLSESEKPKREE